MDGVKSSKQFNRAIGGAGEAIAAAHLTRLGFEILTTNFKNKIGEVDIIAKKDNIVHFVEVKLRTRDGFGFGREAVNRTKQRTIRKVASAFLISHGLYDNVDCCFDVIEITGTPDNYDLEFLENCF